MAGCVSEGDGGDAAGTQRGQKVLETAEVSHITRGHRDEAGTLTALMSTAVSSARDSGEDKFILYVS